MDEKDNRANYFQRNLLALKYQDGTYVLITRGFVFL